MPRVVENQLGKFKTDPILKQLQVLSEIRYTGYQNCSVEERRMRFCTDCYEGRCKIAFLRNGINLLLSFPKAPNSQYTSSEYVDFLREPGKVFLESPLIFNGVCVKLYCWIDVEKMRGFGNLAFDEESAQIEDDFLRETMQRKQGDIQTSNAAKSFQDCCNTPSDSVSRSSCIYDCRRLPRSRYSV